MRGKPFKATSPDAVGKSQVQLERLGRTCSLHVSVEGWGQRGCRAGRHPLPARSPLSTVRNWDSAASPWDGFFSPSLSFLICGRGFSHSPRPMVSTAQPCTWHGAGTRCDRARPGGVMWEHLPSQLLTLGVLGLRFLICVLVKNVGPHPSRRCVGSDTGGRGRAEKPRTFFFFFENTVPRSF